MTRGLPPFHPFSALSPAPRRGSLAALALAAASAAALAAASATPAFAQGFGGSRVGAPGGVGAPAARIGAHRGPDLRHRGGSGREFRRYGGFPNQGFLWDYDRGGTTVVVVEGPVIPAGPPPIAGGAVTLVPMSAVASAPVRPVVYEIEQRPARATQAGSRPGLRAGSGPRIVAVRDARGARVATAGGGVRILAVR